MHALELPVNRFHGIISEILEKGLQDFHGAKVSEGPNIIFLAIFL